MAIDKSIRIQDLPESSFLNNDNLIIINDSDNITRSVTFEDFIGSITTLPGGITLPITDLGFPGLSFCSENTEDCGTTGIGSQAECQLFVSVCGHTLVEFGPGELVTIHGDLQVGGDLVINEDSFLKGNVNIGTGCAGPEKFIVSAETTLNCKTDILGDTTIGTAPCATTLEVNAKSTFNCDTNFISEVDFKGDITVGGNLQLGGNIVPPAGGSIDVILDDITINGDAIIGKPPGCTGELKIYNNTTFYCEAEAKDKIIAGDIELDALTGNINANNFIGDGSLLTNLNIPGSLTFKGNINVGDPNDPALGDSNDPSKGPFTGDLYINEVTTVADAAFQGIAGITVEENRLVYYTAFDKWETGSLQDINGFVTLSTEQNNISGDKTFTGVVKVKTPEATAINPNNEKEVVNVEYLSSFVANELIGVVDNYVTLNDVDQEIDGNKQFVNILRANHPDAIPAGDTADPKALVTVEYLGKTLTGGGFISHWTYDDTTKVLSLVPPANGINVTMKVPGTGDFGKVIAKTGEFDAVTADTATFKYIDIKSLTQLP